MSVVMYLCTNVATSLVQKIHALHTTQNTAKNPASATQDSRLAKLALAKNVT